MIEHFIYSLGIMIGIIPCYLWGKIGGDEYFCSNHKTLSSFFHLIHHYQIGFIIVIISGISLEVSHTSLFIVGFGTGITVDDLIFHSIKNYIKKVSIVVGGK